MERLQSPGTARHGAGLPRGCPRDRLRVGAGCTALLLLSLSSPCSLVFATPLCCALFPQKR